MVFAKAPLPGNVKTRLANDLGNINAANIYKNLLHQFLDKVTRLPGLSVQLWCYPNTRHPFFLRCARDFDLHMVRQSGNELGSRMHFAFKYNDKKGVPVKILVGTDIPGIGRRDIKLAIQYLQGQTDVVLTPTFDGGYGLIAMKKASNVVFSNMQWSTPRVFQQTLQRLMKQHFQVKLLEYRRDIDGRKDYRHYRKTLC